MGAYIKCLISTTAICSLVLHLAPEFVGETKKYLRWVCGLIMLITMITPVMKSCENTENIKENVLSFFSAAKNGQQNQTEQIMEAVVDGTVRETAYAIITYLQSEHNIPQNRISVSVITKEGETPEIEQLHLYISECSAAEREKIRMEIEAMLGITTYVFEKN